MPAALRLSAACRPYGSSTHSSVISTACETGRRGDKVGQICQIARADHNVVTARAKVDLNGLLMARHFTRSRSCDVTVICRQKPVCTRT